MMTLLDWSIVGLMVIMVIVIAIYARKYMNTVADFLVADRLAGRYLLTVSGGFYGAISLVAIWEMTYATGLPPTWWANMYVPLSLFLALTGFVTYRFRQTRALTLAEFFEMRYSRKFRFFAGFLCWISGVLNYAIFPLIASRLMVYFMGFPTSFVVGDVVVPTYAVIMVAYLSVALYIACSGGQISIMLTDFVQGALLILIFVVITVFLLYNFEWQDVVTGLQQKVPENQSLLNPFGGSTTSEFNVWFFIIGLLGGVYSVKSWQGNSAYNSSAKTPHEAVVAGVLSNWRLLASGMCLLLIPLIAYSVLHSDTFIELARPIQSEIASLGGDKTLVTQMTVPIFLKHILPTGLLGLMAAVIVCSAISCDDTYLHSWGTILVQDVIIPWRNRPFSPKTHLLVLRLSIVGVAIFAFLFSLFFPLKGFITMFQVLTAAIYTGGAGAVILGGLYWKRGTTAAAWVAMILGTVFCLGGLMIQQSWNWWIDAFVIGETMLQIRVLIIILLLLGLGFFVGALATKKEYSKSSIACLIIGISCLLVAVIFYFYGVELSNWSRGQGFLMEFARANVEKFPISSQWLFFISCVMACGSYIMISLLGKRVDFDMDKLLHRGKYQVLSDQVQGDEELTETPKENFSISKYLGITPEFSRFERFIFWGTFTWSMAWFVIFIIGIVINLSYPLSDIVWGKYWFIYICLNVVLGVVCAIWIFSGGIRDAIRLIQDLKNRKESIDDDGFVRDKIE